MARRDVPDAVRKIKVGTPAHWRNMGVSERQFRTLVRKGELVRWRRGSYVTRVAVEWASGSRRRQHVLHVYVAMDSLPGAVPSHQSAAIMHDLRLLNGLGDVVTLTLPPERNRSGRERSDVILHAAALPQRHLARMYQVPVTGAWRTTVDLARTLPFMDAVVVADSALNLDLATKSELLGVLKACRGWPGARLAKRAIEFSSPGADSPLESCGRVIIHEHGIEAPEIQVAITGERFSYDVDLYWPKYKAIVEFDGMVKYRADEDLRRQFERDRVLRDAGYKVVHVTWKELFGNPGLVIDRIRKAFASGTSF
ncbi:MAG: DUF559 domain-containing protein [Nocardiopsaceae bacterium]|nr:DUF559 domain-containing protein [Nocardiopsaceae bacterium]